MPNNMVVPRHPPHKHDFRGGCMEQKRKPDKVIKRGKTTIEIYAPSPMSEEEHKRRLQEFYNAAWAIWESFSTEEKLKINAECSN